MNLRCRSYAKINWVLEVLGLRPDGYHELRTVLQTIDLHDELWFERTSSGIQVSASEPTLPLDGTNLVYRAAELLQRRKGITAGVRVHINKRIPMGAGLGGGSSNAAITLLALQRLWQVRLGAGELIELAATLGSDVPCFLYGGTVLGVGRGAEVYPLPDYICPYMLVVVPTVHVATPDVYASLRRRLTTQTALAKIADCCAAILRTYQPWLSNAGECDWKEAGANDLEPVVVTAYPEVSRMLQRMRTVGATLVRMSGSGAAAFAVFDSERMLSSGEAQLRQTPWRVIRARAVGRDEYWASWIITE
ncbi:MAG: 4-(cytidine 5'-diphospho)-2-C-methyl-D-erythritol kinase [Acidobacteriota bacterium]|nr:4-(cytidine 5'-diphospho)-2-C-methyl-D-erythritol kinase [Acidobacteriota bacterium]